MLMASDNNSSLTTNQLENCFSELLDNSEGREMMIRRLKEGGHMVSGLVTGGSEILTFSPPGESVGGCSSWLSFPMWFSFNTS